MFMEIDVFIDIGLNWLELCICLSVAENCMFTHLFYFIFLCIIASLSTEKMLSKNSIPNPSPYLPPPSCLRASGHQAECRAPGSRAPSRRYRSGLRPGRRGLRYTRAANRRSVNITATSGSILSILDIIEGINQPRKDIRMTRSMWCLFAILKLTSWPDPLVFWGRSCHNWAKEPSWSFPQMTIGF